jgi:anti-anti-sigma regulatory factor
MPTGAGIRLVGDIDYDVARDIGARIQEQATLQGDVIVDVSNVTFADVSGCRMLVRAAAGLTGGRRLVLLNAGTQLVGTLTACGWLDSPHLVVVRDGEI